MSLVLFYILDLEDPLHCGSDGLRLVFGRALDRHLDQVGASLELDLQEEVATTGQAHTEIDSSLVSAGDGPLCNHTHTVYRELVLDGTDVGSGNVA